VGKDALKSNNVSHHKSLEVTLLSKGFEMDWDI